MLVFCQVPRLLLNHCFQPRLTCLRPRRTFNRLGRVSVQFVQDHSEAQLEWRFYFNSAPSEAVKQELNVSVARTERTVEDRLREEYIDLLPDMRRVDELPMNLDNLQCFHSVFIWCL
jgi:hypothetical protein